MSHKPIASYPTSRNYPRLAELSKNARIVCFVNHRNNVMLRDVALSYYSVIDISFQECWTVSARGTSYINAFNLEEFFAQCQAANLEFIDPEPIKL